MINTYLRLKKKGLTPTVSLIDAPLGGLFEGETKAVKLTMTLYDAETGVVERQQVLLEGLKAFLSQGKDAKNRWNAYKDLYESLSGKSWPND